MRRRNFFIIGAQRSGTTFLYHGLDAHPAICMFRPVQPEPKFFIDESQWNRGISYYESTYFAGCAGAMWWGDKSTSYIEHPVAATRIRECYPDARILVVLRHPIDRAISNYYFSRQNGFENLSFEAAIEREPERLAAGDAQGISVSPYAYAARGRYECYLEEWKNVFGLERIRILLTENLVADPSALMDVFSFLKVERIPIAMDGARRINASEGRHSSWQPEPGVVEKLKERYALTFRVLEDTYGVDLSAWKGKWQ